MTLFSKSEVGCFWLVHMRYFSQCQWWTDTDTEAKKNDFKNVKNENKVAIYKLLHSEI